MSMAAFFLGILFGVAGTVIIAVAIIGFLCHFLDKAEDEIGEN